MEKTLGIRVPDWMVEDVDEAAARRTVSRSDIVRWALITYLEQDKRTNGRQPGTGTKKSGKSARRRTSGRQ